ALNRVAPLATSSPSTADWPRHFFDSSASLWYDVAGEPSERLQSVGMDVNADGKALLAVDLGAQSCRISLLRSDAGEPQLRLLHRFPNSPRETSGGLRWDIEHIFSGLQTGLRLAAQAAPEGISSIAIDGWAVDYVRLLPNQSPAADPFCYRDPRTE